MGGLFSFGAVRPGKVSLFKGRFRGIVNMVAYPFFVAIKAQKKGKLLISHRYNRIPLLNSLPGGVLQELVV